MFVNHTPFEDVVQKNPNLESNWDIMNIGQPISEHVPRINQNIHAPVNVVFWLVYSDTESTVPYSSNYETPQPIMSIECDQVDYCSIHGGLYMSRFSYK